MDQFDADSLIPCPSCTDLALPEDMFFNSCSHYFCYDCMNQHLVTTAAESAALFDLDCPEPGCTERLSHDQILSFVTGKTKAFYCSKVELPGVGLVEAFGKLMDGKKCL